MGSRNNFDLFSNGRGDTGRQVKREGFAFGADPNFRRIHVVIKVSPVVRENGFGGFNPGQGRDVELRAVDAKRFGNRARVSS